MMGFESIGFFGKAKMFLGILGVVLMFSGFVIAVANSAWYLIKTGDPKPLISDTGGYLVGNDASILKSVEELKKETLSKEYTDYLKNRILQGILGLALSVFLGYIVIKRLFTIGMPPDQVSLFTKFFLVIISIIFITMAGVLYKGIILHAWSVNPYIGITELIKNWGVISNVGISTILSVGNATIQNVTVV